MIEYGSAEITKVAIINADGTEIDLSPYFLKMEYGDPVFTVPVEWGGTLPTYTSVSYHIDHWHRRGVQAVRKAAGLPSGRRSARREHHKRMRRR